MRFTSRLAAAFLLLWPIAAAAGGQPDGAARQLSASHQSEVPRGSARLLLASSSSGRSRGWQVSLCPSTFTAAVANRLPSRTERGRQDHSMTTRHHTVPPGSTFLGHPITALKEISYRDDFGAMAANFELRVSGTFERVVQTAASRFRRSPTAVQLASSATFVGEGGYRLRVIYREDGVQISCSPAEF